MRRTFLTAFCILFSSHATSAQGLDDPLTIQGIDHTTLHSAASRGSGGITIGIQNDVSLMFTNPAALRSLEGLQVSVGGLQRSEQSAQSQQYAPLKYYPNFSLVMEGLTGYIPDPDTSFGGSNPGDTVQRPYDGIPPGWSRSHTRSIPVQAMVAVPLTVGELPVTIGFGVVEYANLRHYYQNNNVLSPAIGSERPVPIALPPNNPDSSVTVQWYQYLRSRVGSIRGYGAAIAVSLTDRISLGLSDMILSGSSDDYEERMWRGRFTFYYNYFRLDPANTRTSTTATSDYTGNELNFSGIYRGRHVSIGFSVKPPTTITRKFTQQVHVAPGPGPAVPPGGTEKVKLPWRGTMGLSLSLLDNLTLGLEYELRSFASAVYVGTEGNESRPWLSSSLFHVGAVFQPASWLILRGGIRGQAEVFEPSGNPIVGDPVTYSVYSAGAGIFFDGFRLNVTYEYSSMNYQDIWQTNVNLNTLTHHDVIADLAYEIPWGL
jgi:opacity protein-like surface antigen